MPATRQNDTWHHVAATYNGTTRTLYLDGIAIGSDAPGVHTVPDARNLRIGSNSNGAFTYLNGRLDEVRVYSVALTPAQLWADMVSTTAAVPATWCSTTTSTRAYRPRTAPATTPA